MSTLEGIARALKVEPASLLGETPLTDVMEAAVQRLQEQMKRMADPPLVPRVGRVACGLLREAIQDADLEMVPAPSARAAKDGWVAFVASGTSMEPVFQEGATLFGRPVTRLRDGQIHVLETVDGQAACKVLHQQGDSLELVPINPASGPPSLLPAEQVKRLWLIVAHVNS